MQSILDAINEWIKDILIGSIQGNLEALFGDVNEKVGTIAAEVGKTRHDNRLSQARRHRYTLGFHNSRYHAP